MPLDAPEDLPKEDPGQVTLDKEHFCHYLIDSLQRERAQPGKMLPRGGIPRCDSSSSG
jgi:hypothetical protein